MSVEYLVVSYTILSELILCLLSLLTLVPVSVVFVQVLAAMPARRRRDMADGYRPRVAILVPAHNEALMIANTLRAILAQVNKQDRVLVVADNCADDTAVIAARLGVEVIERTDTQRVGKGYALDFGVRHLMYDPPQVALVIDADCEMHTGAIDRIAKLCLRSGRPVQALYLMRSPQGSGLKMQLAEFAWTVRNYVRPLGYDRLGLPCQLDGTGMAFPWPAISQAPLASGHIVEDLMLGINLARSGMPPLFCPDALVTSVFPRSDEGVKSQRIRWEHGHLSTIINDAPSLFADGLRRADRNLVALALDLSVPPMALLVLLVVLMFAASLVSFATGGMVLPLYLAGTVLGMLALAVLLAWWRYGRPIIPPSSLAIVPFYVLAKIPVYLKFLVRRQIEWVRSKRETDK